MDFIEKIDIVPGLLLVNIRDAGLSLQCGCIADSVKHLRRRGLIHPTQKSGFPCETGPHAILLSDQTIHQKQFCNLAEFPVMQMLYRQAMITPGHPNNTGRKPLLIGSPAQLDAQLGYIKRGSLGLLSPEELTESGVSAHLADLLYDIKRAFQADKRTTATDVLVDTVAICNEAVEIWPGVAISRLQPNTFLISYRDETVEIDLSVSPEEEYQCPYPLEFHDIKREYFAVIHSGQGDGWDHNRPAMASIIIHQGLVYLIDAGPQINHCLTALGIGSHEIGGIFQTHCHDDHCAGLSTFLFGDRRIPYYATAFVRASVFKKLAALLGWREQELNDYFKVDDLSTDVWNSVDGLEVLPRISPHPVETTTLWFRTYWGGRYYRYAHLADIACKEVLDKIRDKTKRLDEHFIAETIHGYLAPADLKKIDVGEEPVHGCVEDFADDQSTRIVLAHTSRKLTDGQKTIGADVPFGVTDVLVACHNDCRYVAARRLLENFFADFDGHLHQALLNNPIVRFTPGTIIHRSNSGSDFVMLIVCGRVALIHAQPRYSTVFGAGALLGPLNQLARRPGTEPTYIAHGFVHALVIDASDMFRLLEDPDLHARFIDLRHKEQTLRAHPLFGDGLSDAVRISLARKLTAFEVDDSAVPFTPDPELVYLTGKGALAHPDDAKVNRALGPGDWLSYFGKRRGPTEANRLTPSPPVQGYTLHVSHALDVPLLRWRLTKESHQDSCSD
jgi:hemerythrin